MPGTSDLILSKKREYGIFFKKVTSTAPNNCATIQFDVYKVFKAVNKNTMRRLGGEGWKRWERKGPLTKERANELCDELIAAQVRGLRVLQDHVGAEIDRIHSGYYEKKNAK